MTIQSSVLRVTRAATVLSLNLKATFTACRPILVGCVWFVIESILFHTNTLYLFTSEDIVAYLLPIMSFALAASPTSVLSTLSSCVWIWLHLLQHGTSSQSLSIALDKRTAAYLPIPAGRVTTSHVEALRWLLLPACLAYSLWLGVPAHGVVIMLVILALNEFRLDKYWLTRNVLRAVLFVALDSAAFDSGKRHNYPYYPNFLLILTTVSMRDFNVRVPTSTPPNRVSFDQKAQHPVLHYAPSTLARLMLTVVLPLWSAYAALSMILSFEHYLTAGLVVLGFGLYLALRLWWRRTPAGDRKSSRQYSLWLTLVRVVPIIARV